MTPGTLSVIMPNYNHAHLISTALTAILEQSHRPAEVIVVDDGSTDSSVEVIQSLVKRDPIVRLVRHPQNRGLMAAVASGLEAARGDLVYFPAADDQIRPGFFEKSLRMLAAYPQAGLVFSHDTHFDDATGKVFNKPIDLGSEPRYLSPEELTAERRWHIGGHTVILRRSAFEAAGGYIPELRCSCDWFCNQVVMFRHGACFVPETLALFRDSPDSYHQRCWRDRNIRIDVLRHMLQRLVSPAYRDVLPLFQKSRILYHMEDLAYAACQAQLHNEPEVVALAATLEEKYLAVLLHDEDPIVCDFGRRVIAHRLTDRNDSLEMALMSLYGQHLILQVEVQRLQNLLSEVRNWTPLRIHRHLVSPVRTLVQGLYRRIRKFSTRATGPKHPALP